MRDKPTGTLSMDRLVACREENVTETNARLAMGRNFSGVQVASEQTDDQNTGGRLKLRWTNGQKTSA